MMKYNRFMRTFIVAMMVVLAACGAVGQKGAHVNPLSVPLVEVDNAGFFSVADCPTQHPVLGVRLHEGEAGLQEELLVLHQALEAGDQAALVPGF